jgi:hypothetical protein
MANGTTADYARALTLALLYYKAQRAGKLPDNNVPWRRDAFVDVRTSDGRRLGGFYFDAGDALMFMLPQATTISNLAWSMVDFAAPAKEAVTWGADFLARSVLSPQRLVVQIGLGPVAHSAWTRPQDQPGQPFPVFELGTRTPGADVAGAVAAALAASAMAVNATDRSRANAYLSAARTAYTFGKAYPGRYTDGFEPARAYYRSVSYLDDMAFAAAWLWRATGQAAYLTDARAYLRRHLAEEGMPWAGVDWDNQGRLAAVLLKSLDRTAPAADRARYDTLVRGLWNAWTPPGRDGVRRTPLGLMWLARWGSLRYNANAQFAMLLDARLSGNADAWQRAVCFARDQMAYMLGTAPSRQRARSYVIGYGPRWPLRPHHRAASCPVSGTCDWRNFDSPAPNPNVLLGGMVGGPGEDDSWSDERRAFQSTETALDKNAGLVGALAGLTTRAARSVPGASCP